MSQNFKVGVCYPDGRKEITYLSSRSLGWILAIIESNTRQGIRTLVLIKE
jgi:hypothetical protein